MALEAKIKIIYTFNYYFPSTLIYIKIKVLVTFIEKILKIINERIRKNSLLDKRVSKRF